MIQSDEELLLEEEDGGRVLTKKIRKIFLVIFASVVGVGLTASIAVLITHKSSSTGFCQYQPKISWLQPICNNLKLGENPCVDFYQYTCGGWESHTTVPNGLTTWDRFMDTGKNIYAKIKNSFDTGDTIGSAEIKAKQFFDLCMKETRDLRSNTLDKFRSYLTTLKGNPLTSSLSVYQISKLLPKIHEHGVWPLFKLLVRTHPNDRSKQILTIAPGQSPFSGEGFTDFNREKLSLTTPQQRYKVLNLITNENEMESGVKKMLELDKDINMLIFNRIWQVSLQSRSCHFYDIHCTPEKSEAEKLAMNMLNLEVDITLALVKGIHRRVDSYAERKKYKVTTIRKLEWMCPWISWNIYFKTLTKRIIPVDTEIMIIGEESLLEVCKVVRDYTVDSEPLSFGSKKTHKKRIFGDYLLVSLAKSLLVEFDTGLLLNEYKEKFKQYYKTNHWYRCMIRTNEAFGIATGSIYIRKITSAKEDATIDNVKHIISYVKKAYKNKLLNADWLDEKTKAKSKKKINYMLDKVGYPKEIENRTYRDSYYSKFDVYKFNWFNNVIRWKKFMVMKLLSDIWEPSDRGRWSLTPATINAEHDLIRNNMNLPISLFQLPFYSPNRPVVMNFGSLGSIIGHEMTHAFGKTGSMFDEYGIIDDWMTRKSENVLIKKSKCLVKQYGSFTIEGHKFSRKSLKYSAPPDTFCWSLYNLQKSNPNLTIDEDIADTGGIRAAYYAYQLWKIDNGDGIDSGTITWMKTQNLTEDQLFFIAFSQTFCQKYTSVGLKRLSGHHSPGPFRVKGSLSNTDFFQKAYGCAPRSAYAPEHRCRVW